MKEARLYVDFNEMIEEDLVLLSKTDFKIDSNRNNIELYEGLHVKIYDNDLSCCSKIDNLIADGTVELNTNIAWTNDAKWNCRIDKAGIYNESQKSKK
jgi:hypothetical protein